MARHYAGVLGSIAFVTIVIRGLRQGAPFEQTLETATLSLVVFGFVGFLVGRLAGWIVLDSVRAQLAAELADRPAHESPRTLTTT